MLQKQTVRRLQDLDASTRRLFAFLRAVPQDLLTQAPSPQSWNILQAVNHIYLAEQLSLRYVRYKVQDPESIPPYTPMTIVRMWLVRWILLSPVKLKAPNAIDMWGDQPVLHPADLQDAWKQLRAELHSFIGEYELLLKKRRVYKHIYAGRITLGQMLVFFRLHLEHHHRQARQILDALRRKS
jgi:hypothetical protein